MRDKRQGTIDSSRSLHDGTPRPVKVTKLVGELLSLRRELRIFQPIHYIIISIMQKWFDIWEGFWKDAETHESPRIPDFLSIESKVFKCDLKNRSKRDERGDKIKLMDPRLSINEGSPHITHVIATKIPDK